MLISMLLHLFSHRMDIHSFLPGPGRARRCAVLNSYKTQNVCLRVMVRAEIPGGIRGERA